MKKLRCPKMNKKVKTTPYGRKTDRHFWCDICDCHHVSEISKGSERMKIKTMLRKFIKR